ncbi:SMI1/KNR4 family protein [Catellatospora tritici]|uniref:SMI1/KNR4 family protein n=1 Tax=Catellatospora tritici TaxID=2851566 RepID=UPI001C2D2E39|nr:SMI1/KNR4 family protein [Catellatospora tritici]MBV1853758.1 SMI1/KNR4 family protein [Catellatospora tritici]
MTDEVTASWVRIEAWLDRHAPASATLLAGPADHAEIDAAESTLGLPFPAELVVSLRRHDGLTEWAGIFPDLPPASVAQIVEYRQICMEVAETVDGFAVSVTGEPWWHPLWLPFAVDVGAMVIDLRPGPGHGRLGWAGHSNPGFFDDGWPSLGAYLDAVAQALHGGGDVGGWFPYLEAGGGLWWSGADETELNGEPLVPAPRF